jgi:hypothetical protein
MYRFPVRIEQRGESFFVIILAVPGCVTGGKSREEALCKARDLLQAVIGHAGPGFSPAANASPFPGDGANGEYLELAIPAAQPC